MSKTVIMVTPNAFPNGDAGSVRDLAFAKIYMELGYTVYHIGQGKESVSGVYEGIKYISLYQRVKSVLEQAKRFSGYERKLKKIIAEYEDESGIPEIIHLYDSPLGGIPYLKEYAKKHNVKLVHDSVEWYSPCEFRKGKWDKSYILKNRLNTKLIDSSFNVIAISSFLESYFKSRGIRAIRVPVIMDAESGYDIEERNLDRIDLTYAGSPAKKDLLVNMIQAFASLDDKTMNKLHFNIVGVSKEQLIEKGLCTERQLKKIENCVNIYGRVPRSKVLDILRESTDFSVLVRPANERYAMAGFPTKSVEAMMNSVAMLCNLTSDLGMYLRDRENAIIVKDESVEALQEGYKRIAELSNDEVRRIRINARSTAREYFDYRRYVSVVGKLLEDR